MRHGELSDENRRVHDMLKSKRETLEKVDGERDALVKNLAAQTETHQDDFKEWSAEREQVGDWALGIGGRTVYQAT